MFNKTKRRIVFTVVASLLILMAVTLTAIYLSNRISLDRESRDMLQTFVSRFSIDGEPPPGDGEGRPSDTLEFRPEDGNEPHGGRDDRRGKDEPAFRLSTFYSVVYDKNGEVLAVNSGNNDLQSEDSLITTASSILESGKASGKTGNMFFLVEERENYTLVAMIDGTLNDNNQTRLFRQMLVIGTVATVILVLISIFIARRIVKPLEENDERQKRFISDAGHELKTPIAVISANSELLRRQSGDSEWLDNIDYENEKMSALVTQLLGLSRAERGEIPKETLDLSKLVSGEALPFESLAFEKSRPLSSTIEDGLSVEGNAGQLRQLVSILLDNALSHSTGGPIDLTLKKEKHTALLTVQNEAEEMSGEQISHLFDRFYRADEAREDQGGHYGLGLSIAKAVVEAHSGSIRAAYKDGKAVFTVYLPLRS